MCHLSVYPSKGSTEYAKPALIKRALIIPGIDFGRQTVLIDQMSLRTKLALSRFIGIKRLPALLPLEMLYTAVGSRHRFIGIQHIMRIKRVDVYIDSHIIHDTAQCLTRTYFSFFILSDRYFFRKRTQRKINGLRLLFGKRRSALFPVGKSDKADYFPFGIFKVPDQ